MKSSQLANYAFFSNFSALTLHEMNAVTWKEWRVFGIVDDVLGERLFILVHFPLYFSLLSICTKTNAPIGRAVSIGLSAFLILHLCMHYAARKAGYFTDAFGFGLIGFVAVTAVIQLITTLMLRPKS